MNFLKVSGARNHIIVTTKVVVLLLLVLITVIECSMKDALPKDIDEQRAQIIRSMQNKVLSLETNMKHINTGLKDMEFQERSMKDSLDEQHAMLEHLQSSFESFEERFQKHNHSLLEFAKDVHAVEHEKLFAHSNNTCGEALVAQSGFLSFSLKPYLETESYAYYGYAFREFKPISCIWPIQANSKSLIKVQTRALSFNSGNGNLSVIEIFPKNENDLQPPQIQIRVTRLGLRTTYLFNGPLIFLVLFDAGKRKHLVTRPTESTFQSFENIVEFEGMGTSTYEHLRFIHEPLPSPFWDMTKLPRNYSQGISKRNQLVKWDVLTLSSNYTGMARLRLGQCNKNSMLFKLPDPSSSGDNRFIDYCKSDGGDVRYFESFAKSFLAFVLVKPKSNSSFPLSLLTEKYSPSTSVPKCGGILSSPFGSASYVARGSNPKRCIWAFIAPLSNHRTRMFLNPSRSMESDLIYFMKMSNINGTLFEAPEFYTAGTRLELFPGESTFVVYESSGSKGSFPDDVRHEMSLNWLELDKSSETKNISTTISGNNVYSTYEHRNDLEGSFEVLNPLEMFPQLEANMFLVFTPEPYFKTIAFNESFSLELNLLNATLTYETNIRVYSPSARDGYLRINEKVDRNQNGTLKIHDTDGLVLVVIPKDSLFSGRISYKWKKEVTSIPEMGDGTCGGVIIGSQGLINYKNRGQNATISESCIWLLYAENSSSVTLKLRIDGFSPHLPYTSLLTNRNNQSHPLIINSINPMTGTVNNDTTTLSSDQRTQTFNSSLLVIQFKFPKLATLHRGFLLQFTANLEADMELVEDDSSPGENLYVDLQHFNSSSADFSTGVNYESASAGETQLKVFAFSYVNNETQPKDSTLQTEISWKRGLFKRNEHNLQNNCSFDTARILVFSEDNYWKEEMRYPNISSDECPDEVKLEGKEHAHSLSAPAFIVIYKVFPVPVENGESNRNQSQSQGFEFAHRTFFKNKTDAGFPDLYSDWSSEEDGIHPILRHEIDMDALRRYIHWRRRLSGQRPSFG